MQRRWFWLPLVLGTLMTMLLWACDGDDDDFAGDDDTGDDDTGDDDDDDDDDDADDDGGDDDGSDDDTATDDDSGDDDTTPILFHVTGTMVPSAQDPPPIDPGVTLFVALYDPNLWDATKDYPANKDIHVNAGHVTVEAPGTWPVVFDVPAYLSGSFHLWALADQDGSGSISEGDAWGGALGNPLNVTSDISGAQIVLDSYWAPPQGDDDVGDDDSGDDDDVTVPPG
jgi:hypothetical protein